MNIFKSFMQSFRISLRTSAEEALYRELTERQIDSDKVELVRIVVKMIKGQYITRVELMVVYNFIFNLAQEKNIKL